MDEVVAPGDADAGVLIEYDTFIFRAGAVEEEQRLADLRERRQVADAPKLKREREDKEGEDINLISRVSSRSTAKAGDTIKIAIDSSRMHFFDKETEQIIVH